MKKVLNKISSVDEMTTGTFETNPDNIKISVFKIEFIQRKKLYNLKWRVENLSFKIFTYINLKNNKFYLLTKNNFYDENNLPVIIIWLKLSSLDINYC